MNPYYQPGPARGERVQDLFAEIAPRYDLVNDLQSFGLHRLWKRKLARLAQLGKGMRALDVCCGTGDISLALAASGARVVGVDFSAPMLRVAGARASSLTIDSARSAHAEDSDSPSFLQGDALRLPFPDNTFEAVAVSYGLRNLSSWQRGLEEMWRVTKSGGRLLVLDFGKPANSLWRSAYFAYLKIGVPLFGRLFCKNAPAYAYIYESLQHYPAQEGVAAHLRQLGCRNVRIMNLVGGAMSINTGTKE